MKITSAKAGILQYWGILHFWPHNSPFLTFSPRHRKCARIFFAHIMMLQSILNVSANFWTILPLQNILKISTAKYFEDFEFLKISNKFQNFCSAFFDDLEKMSKRWILRPKMQNSAVLQNSSLCRTIMSSPIFVEALNNPPQAQWEWTPR